MAGLRGIVGGEIKDYAVMLDKARDQAVERMIRRRRALQWMQSLVFASRTRKQCLARQRSLPAAQRCAWEINRQYC